MSAAQRAEVIAIRGEVTDRGHQAIRDLLAECDRVFREDRKTGMAGEIQTMADAPMAARPKRTK